MTLHATPPIGLSSDSGGLILLLRARLGGPALDAQLAVGEDPTCDPVLAARSAQLLSRGARHRIAAGLLRACQPRERRSTLSSAVPVNAAAVDAARPALLKLAAALRCRSSVRPRGVALAQRLLTEGDGPLYTPSGAQSLDEAARAALLALGPEVEPATSKGVRSRWT